MAFVVTDNCQRCRFTDCVSVCPVDCFYSNSDDDMVYINPDECIDCGACEPECPVEAIFDEANLPPDKSKWLAVNAEMVQSRENITQKQSPYPGADERKKALGF